MSSPRPLDAEVAARQIKTLAESARALVQQGNVKSAEEIYRRILDVAPYHGPALSFFARQANDAGDPLKALSLVEQAIKGNPGKLVHIQNRAKIYSALGRLDEALKDLEAVLVQRPDHPAVLFHKALLLRDMGDRKAAVRVAIQAWQRFPNPEIIAADPELPDYLRGQIIECANLIRSTQLIFVDSELTPLIERHGKPALERVFAAVGAFAGLQDQLSSEPQPFATGLSLPKLGTIDDSEQLLPWGAALAAHLDGFRQLAAQLLPPASSLKVLRSASGDAAKLATFLGTIQPSIPQTSDVPVWACVLQIPGGTHVLQLRNGDNWRLDVYMPLEMGKGVTLASGTDTETCREGKPVVLSPSGDQLLNNPAATPVRILRFCIWHPDVTAAEREGIQAAYRAMRRFDEQYVQPSAPMDSR